MKKQQINKNIKKREDQISDIDQQLSLVKGVSEKQQERKSLEEETKNHKINLEELQTKMKKLVSKNGYLAPTHILHSKVSEKLANLPNDMNEDIPDLSERLINHVIDQGICICGERITEKHISHLKEAAEKITTSSQMTFLNSLNKDLSIVGDSRERFLTDLHELEKREYQIKEKFFDTQNRLSEISVELSNRDLEDVQSLEKNRRAYQYDINEYYKELGVIEQQMKELTVKLDNISKQITKQEQIQDKAQLAKRRMETCEKLTSVMQRIYSLKEEEVKKDLQKKLEEVYSNFLRKGFKIYLTEDFKLNVQSYYGDKVPLSQGERQITSLSFIGAIVDIARKHHKKASDLMNEGGIYPLVMDSPFGALDSDHRQRVAKGIHTLSEQIIIIVSTSQWKGEVEENLKPYIGREYLLKYHDSRNNQDNQYEYTEIQRW